MPMEMNLEIDEDPAPKKVSRITPEDLVVAFRKKFDEEMLKQVNEFDGTEITKTITDRLNQDRQNTIWKLLGLDDKWGKLEVDHCNNRRSPISEMIEDAVQEEVKVWLHDALKEVIETNRPKLKAEFRKAFLKEIQDRMRWQMRSGAEEAAKTIVGTIAEEAKKEFMEGVRNVRYEEAQREGSAGQAHAAQGESHEA